MVCIQVNKDNHYELVLSRIGQQKTEFVLAKVVSDHLKEHVKIGSEHVIKTRGKKIIRHWFSFEINCELYFVDLIDTSRKVKMSPVSSYKWIPNESKS